MIWPLYKTHEHALDGLKEILDGNEELLAKMKVAQNLKDELKKDYGLNANSNIYEIQTEYDGRKVLSVKADLKFKVAFCSMIKKEIPKFEELDEIMYNNYLQEKVIWIENDSRDKIINLLNNNEKLNSEYKVNSEGYLIIDKKNNQSELDKTVEKSINSDAQTILVVSSLCYIVDDVTGDILDYNFEKMDKYQTYEYFNDDDKKIVFITENKNNQISSEELLEDIINIL